MEITILPNPSFVVKTRVEPNGSKVFINVCSSDKVPLPEVDFDPATVYQLVMNNQWEIPIITGKERLDVDKKGMEAAVFDCVIHPKAMTWVQMDDQLRQILIEWCLESVEVSSGTQLSRDHIALPKMRCKGEVQPITVLEDDLKKNTVEKLIELDNEPMSILQAKRFDDEQVEEFSSNIDIFNVNGVSSNTNRKPLIEEISEMRVSPKPHEVKVQEKETLNYETTMSKVDTNGFKLLIVVKSQIKTSLDYELELNTTTSTIILKNLNANFKAKPLEIPLPFDNPTIKSFYVHSKQSLHIFVK